MSTTILTKTQMRRLEMFSDDLEHMTSPEKEFFPLLEEIESPEEFFYLPMILNWDEDLTEKAMPWILKSPLCDAGVALSIYWLNQPTNWIDHKESKNDGECERRGLSLHRSIESRMKSLDFPSQIIQYDPRWDWGYWNDDGSEDDRIANVPYYMKRSTPGKKLPDFFDLPWKDIE